MKLVGRHIDDSMEKDFVVEVCVCRMYLRGEGK